MQTRNIELILHKLPTNEIRYLQKIHRWEYFFNHEILKESVFIFNHEIIEETEFYLIIRTWTAMKLTLCSRELVVFFFDYEIIEEVVFIFNHEIIEEVVFLNNKIEEETEFFKS